MLRTWRWFGRKDKVTLDMLRQIGVEGIVTALYDVPGGDVWSVEAITGLKNFIEAEHLKWSVVESLPVSEEIKYGGPRRDALIDNYIVSLENLGRCGVKTVCYNFMPVIDWIRTDLHYRRPDGTYSLYFDYARFAYFDIHILERERAEESYDAETLRKVSELDRVITQAEKDALIDTIIVKTQGFVNDNFRDGEREPVRRFRQLLSLYDGIGRDRLRENMKYFLERIMPVCDRYDIRMCVHPDDPPYQVLGLPRIVCCDDDIDWLYSAVDDFHNGLAFCAGSLSSSAGNDVLKMARRYLDRIHFVHLRSTEPDPGTGNFIEAGHLTGRGHVPQLVELFEKEGAPDLPFRVDHGRCMLGDENMEHNPGYPFFGRMHALAEVMGMISMVHKNN